MNGCESEKERECGQVDMVYAIGTEMRRKQKGKGKEKVSKRDGETRNMNGERGKDKAYYSYMECLDDLRAQDKLRPTTAKANMDQHR